MKKIAYSLAFIIIILFAITFPSTSKANSLSTFVNTPKGFTKQGLTYPAEMEAFLDDFFTNEMKNLHIPGAAFVMVKDGNIFFMKGYGYADIEKRIPVDPQRTLFRAGSISKLFTCTAVMQAVEQGLLSLNTDVNEYLTDFQIPSTFSEPITLHHLMTHTAGFEDRWIGYETHDADKITQLGQFVGSNVPGRVVAPGLLHSYSNYGIDLSGYLVEKAFGIPFPEYVWANIFKPLGMVRSTFEQYIPESMASDLAVGYQYTGVDYQAVPFSYVLTAPSSGISTTAENIAAFMIAHLQNGRYRDTYILQEATARQMHQQQFTHDLKLPGITYGFKERYINGQRVIGHGGDLHSYASQMILLPEQNEGFFVLYNRYSDTFREDLINAFFNHYYPSQPEITRPSSFSLTKEDLSRYSGSYRWVKYPRSTLGKLIALIPGPYNLKIKSNTDGSLSLSFFGTETEWRYAPIEPLVFKQISGGSQRIGELQVDPGDTMVFREGDNNRITYGFVPLQNTAFERLSWYELPEVMLGTLGALMIVFLSPFILWPVIALLRRLLKRPLASTGGSRRFFWIAGILSGLDFIFLAGLFLTFGENMVFGLTPVVMGLLVIPIITIPLTLILLGMNVLAWKKRYWSVLGRIYYTFISLSAVVFIIWANYWNLIGFRF